MGGSNESGVAGSDGRSDSHPRVFIQFFPPDAGSREPLVSLLEGLLDGENMNVMLRGVYLTSSLQRGQMDDIFTQSAARQYRLGNNPLASWPWWTPRLISPAACSRRHYSQSLIWQQRAAPG